MREFGPGYMQAPYRVPVALEVDFPDEAGLKVDDFRVACATIVMPIPLSERPS